MFEKYLKTVIRMLVVFLFLLGLNYLLYNGFKIGASVFGAIFGVLAADYIRSLIDKPKKPNQTSENNG